MKTYHEHTGDVGRRLDGLADAMEAHERYLNALYLIEDSNGHVRPHLNAAITNKDRLGMALRAIKRDLTGMGL